MFDQTFTFSFEAAHELSHAVKSEPGHRYARLHGHSFVVSITLRAAALKDGRWIVDFNDLKAACDDVKQELDHRLLNEVEGLEIPTLENIAFWIYTKMSQRFPAVHRVQVARPTLNEQVAYSAGV